MKRGCHLLWIMENQREKAWNDDPTFSTLFSFLTSRQRRRLRSVFLTKTVYPSQHVQGILFHIQILIQQIFKVSSFGIVKPLTILSISPQTAMIVESCIRPDGVSFKCEHISGLPAVCLFNIFMYNGVFSSTYVQQLFYIIWQQTAHWTTYSSTENITTCPCIPRTGLEAKQPPGLRLVWWCHLGHCSKSLRVQCHSHHNWATVYVLVY